MRACSALLTAKQSFLCLTLHRKHFACSACSSTLISAMSPIHPFSTRVIPHRFCTRRCATPFYGRRLASGLQLSTFNIQPLFRQRHTQQLHCQAASQDTSHGLWRHCGKHAFYLQPQPRLLEEHLHPVAEQQQSHAQRSTHVTLCAAEQSLQPGSACPAAAQPSVCKHCLCS